jgi:hypothetical protein
MAAITKAELTIALNKSLAEVEVLRNKCAQLEERISAMQSTKRTSTAPTQEQSTFRARCQAARARAMSSGKSVLV